MKARWNGRTKLLVLLLTLGFIVSCVTVGQYLRANSNNGVVVEENIISEARELRKNNRAAIVDISDLVKKYITAGTSQEAVKAYLTGQGFKLFSQPTRPNGNGVLVAIMAPLEKSSKGILGFHDEVKIIIETNHNRIEAVRGEIIYRAL